MDWKLEVEELRKTLNDLVQVLPYTKIEIAKKIGIGFNTMNYFLTGNKIPTRLVIIKIREFIYSIHEENQLAVDERH